MPIDWGPLREIIDNNQRFLLSSHVRPDADAVGSELGLAELLESRGKSVRIVNPSALPTNLAYLDPQNRVKKIGDGISIDEACDVDVHIVVDTSAWAQLVDVGQVLKRTNATRVVIDHHVSSDDLQAVEFKDTTCEATGTLIYRLYQDMGAQPSEFAATALYSAIATDTGWFRFPSTTSETMSIGAALIDAGAKPHVIYKELYEQNSLARIQLAGRVLARISLDCDGRLASIYATNADFRETGAVPADTENLVNECLKIAGVECCFIAVEQRNGQIKISLRSRSNISVAAVAEKFGGGGHNQAAGVVLPAPIKEAQAKILAELKSVLARGDGEPSAS